MKLIYPHSFSIDAAIRSAVSILLKLCSIVITAQLGSSRRVTGDRVQNLLDIQCAQKLLAMA